MALYGVRPELVLEAPVTPLTKAKVRKACGRCELRTFAAKVVTLCTECQNPVCPGHIGRLLCTVCAEMPPPPDPSLLKRARLQNEKKKGDREVSS